MSETKETKQPKETKAPDLKQCIALIIHGMCWTL